VCPNWFDDIQLEKLSDNDQGEKRATGKKTAGRPSCGLICFDMSTFSSNEKVELSYCKVIASGLSRAILTRPGISGRNIWASQLNTSKCISFGCQEFFWEAQNIVRKCLLFNWLRVLYKSIVLEDVFCHEFAIIAARSRCSAITCRTPII
jgi:hypothetical protein